MRKLVLLSTTSIFGRVLSCNFLCFVQNLNYPSIQRVNVHFPCVNYHFTPISCNFALIKCLLDIAKFKVQNSIFDIVLIPRSVKHWQLMNYFTFDFIRTAKRTTTALSITSRWICRSISKNFPRMEEISPPDKAIQSLWNWRYPLFPTWWGWNIKGADHAYPIWRKGRN